MPGSSKKVKIDRFVALPYVMLNSPAFKDLSPYGVRVFLELKKRFNGSNNGEISLSVREVASLCGCGKDKASAAIHDLIGHGFVYYSDKGIFTNRRASTFILTCERINGHPKTDDWKSWPNNNAAINKTKYLLPDL